MPSSGHLGSMTSTRQKRSRAAPKRSPRPQARQPRTRTRARARRVGNLAPYTGQTNLSVFSPLHPGNVPSSMPEGNAFPVRGMVRANFTTDSTTGWLLLIGQTGQSANVMMSWSNIATPATTSYVVPTLALADDAGGPSAGRAMKAGFTMVNSSPVTSVSGLVYVLPASQRLLLPAAATSMTQAHVNSVMTAVKAHPETQIFSAGNFVEPRAFYSHVVDDIQYSTYEAWAGTEARDDYVLHAAIWPGANPSPRPLNFFWVYMDSTTLGNTYTVTVDSAFYTRWSLGTIMAQNETPVPLASLPTVVAQRKAAEQQGSTGHSAGPGIGGAIATGALGGLNEFLRPITGLPGLISQLPAGSASKAANLLRAGVSGPSAYFAQGAKVPYAGLGLLGALL